MEEELLKEILLEVKYLKRDYVEFKKNMEIKINNLEEVVKETSNDQSKDISQELGHITVFINNKFNDLRNRIII